MKTSCEKCCFLKSGEDGRKCCAAEQYCLMPVDSNKVETPGFCKLKRTESWKSRKPRTLDDKELLAIVRQENDLEFDLIIIFDEWLHDIDDLERTIDPGWMDNRCKQIIVADITGSDQSGGHSLDYFRSYDGNIPLKVDCTLTSESAVRAIRRMSHRCMCKSFLVLPAGKILSDVKKLSHDIKYVDHKFILAMFHQKYGETILGMKGNTMFSLYQRDIFKRLTSHCQETCVGERCACKPFFNDVKTVESLTKSEIFLTQFMDGCIIV